MNFTVPVYLGMLALDMTDASFGIRASVDIAFDNENGVELYMAIKQASLSNRGASKTAGMELP